MPHSLSNAFSQCELNIESIRMYFTMFSVDAPYFVETIIKKRNEHMNFIENLMARKWMNNFQMCEPKKKHVNIFPLTYLMDYFFTLVAFRALSLKKTVFSNLFFMEI